MVSQSNPTLREHASKLIQSIITTQCEPFCSRSGDPHEVNAPVVALSLREMAESDVASIARLAVYEDPVNHSEQWIQVLSNVAKENGQRFLP